MEILRRPWIPTLEGEKILERTGKNMNKSLSSGTIRIPFFGDFLMGKFVLGTASRHWECSREALSNWSTNQVFKMIWQVSKKMELLVGFQVTPDTWLNKMPGAAAVFVPSKEYAVQKVIIDSCGSSWQIFARCFRNTHLGNATLMVTLHLVAHDVLGYNRYVYPPEVELGNRFFTFSK